ncbi:MAG: hypothetical protein K6C36_07995 [Clostridia bacterium]|nr:hypothetical protein [Clostridia bacterium]
MERKLNAELWDKMHYLFRDFNDRMVHVRLDYDFEIDAEALKTVLFCFVEKAPVLHSSFYDNKFHPYWRVENYHINDIFTVKDVSEETLEAEVDAFLLQSLPPESKVQMKAALFLHAGKSTFCLIENHMCMDGGDLKYFLKALCGNYTAFLETGASPVGLRTGSRSYEAVYGDFTATERKIAKGLYKNINTKDGHGFPLTPDTIADRPFMAKRKISAQKFDLLRAAGKERGATINDMLLTAYFYSLYELAMFPPEEGISVSCAVDLRRHIKDRNAQGVTNQTAWMQTRVPRKGRDIFETLDYVVQSSNAFKRDRFMGLHGLPLLSLGYKILPHAASEEIIKLGYANPLIAMSNIGILESEKLALSGYEPTDGFISGAVKYKPYALLSVTSLRKELTLSMCCRGNEQDKDIVNRFFDLLEQAVDRLLENAEK